MHTKWKVLFRIILAPMIALSMFLSNLGIQVWRYPESVQKASAHDCYSLSINNQFERTVWVSWSYQANDGESALLKWGDGHETGIYSFEYLRKICPCKECSGEDKKD